jgi:hypothetical protein
MCLAWLGPTGHQDSIARDCPQASAESPAKSLPSTTDGDSETLKAPETVNHHQRRAPFECRGNHRLDNRPVNPLTGR